MKNDKVKYDSFEDSREFARKLNLSSASQWRDFAYSSMRPKGIPSHPDRYYKNCGWINWVDWLNTNNKQGGNLQYHVNDDYFKKQTANMYYILGFWFADGYMDDVRNKFSITQHKSDKYLLEKMLKDMNSNHPLNVHNKNNLSFCLSSSEIIKDVKKYGGETKKSFTIRFPSKIDKKYLPDFIRGYFDGDGCISYQKNEKCFVSSMVSASKYFIHDLLDILTKEIKDFNGSIGFYNNVYVLSMGVNDTRRLRDYIYQKIDVNSLYLKRKYEKFVKSGEIRIASFNKEFLSYKEASNFIKQNNIKKQKDWKVFKSQNKIDNIPSNPDSVYKNKGWVNWKSFAGVE